MNEFDQAILGLPQGDEYDRAVSAQPPDAVPARFGYLAGSQQDPEAYAEARRVAASTGVPLDTALALPQEMKRQAAMGSIDFDAMAATAPATAALLADVQKASVAHDNVGSLQSVEQTINALAGRRESKAFAPLRPAPVVPPELGLLDRALNAVGDATSTGLGFAGGTLSAIAAAIPKFNEGAWGLLRAGGDMLPSAVGQPIADFASQMGGAARGMGDAMMPKADGLLGSAWYSGMQSFGLNLLQLPLAFLPGGQAPLAASIAGQVAPRMSPVLWSMGAVTGGEAYGKARDKGVGVLPALAFGASQGVIEAGTEMIGMPALFSLLKPGQFAAKAAEYLLKEQGGEQLATHMQDLNEWAVLNPDKPFSDYLHERPAAAVQTALSVLFAGAAQAGTVRGVGHVLYKARDEAEKAQASEQQSQLLAQLTQIAQADKLLAREPDTFEAFVQQAAEDGPVESIYIDGNVLMQSGLMPELAQVSPAIAAQAAEAAKAGGLVAIPVGEYTARIAPTEQGQALLDHLKTDPEGFSRAEAQAYLQTQGEQLQQDIIKSLTDSVQAEQALADVATVRGALRDELLAAGRRPDVADAESAVLGAYYATRAQDLGLTASELFEQRRLRIGSQVLGGAQFDQAEPIESVRARIADLGVDAELSQSKGVITLSKIVVPEGERGAGVGTQAMQALVDYADRTGQHIALTPSSDFGGDKKRLTAFYKRFGFVENKGKNRAFSTKEGMYRQAAGKVLYQNNQSARDAEYLDAVERGDMGAAQRLVNEAAASAGYAGASDHRMSHGAPNSTDGFSQSMATVRDSDMVPADYWTHPQLYQSDARERAAFAKLSGLLRSMDARKAEGRDPGGAAMTVYRAVPKSTKEGSLRNGDWVSPTEAYARDEGASIPGGFRIISQVVSAKDLYWDGNSAAELGYDNGKGYGYKNTKNSRKLLDAVTRDDSGNVVPLSKRFDARKAQEYFQGPRGTFSPERLTITLMTGADLSTTLHEAGHFFFENDIALASEIVAGQRQGASVSEGEQRILRDVGTLLTWHGMKGDLAQQLAEWHNLDFEEKRAHHERTAESFERYLFEGKAPSLELTGYFQRFRSWMVGVYRSIKDFLGRNPQAGQLSDDVRAVFDRMLATDDQIALAEQGRSLVPLFENAEQAGMTPEEFAAYQANGQQATADAVDELQARGLRDMQWLRNARGRELKRLQAEAKGLRAEQETEARLEVYADPLYRAWRFLTGKLTEEDQLPEPVKTSGGQTLNPEVDSLLVAISKLGGITRESAGQHLGVHADNFKHPSGVFGAPVFRKTGGLSADAMAERLAELGYLLPDEDGEIDLHDLEGKIDSELRGHPEYSVARDLSGLGRDEPRAGEGVDVQALGAARLDATELKLMGLPDEVIQTLKARRMVAKNGLHPDLVAEQFGFTSGDELVRKLAAADTPREMVEALTDVRMLEAHGELATPEAIERAADEAIHNRARLRMVATEEAALAKATGKPRVLESAAREYAAQLIAGLRVRDLQPSRYTNAQSRAAKESAKAKNAGDIARAAAEKRNQLLQGLAAREALQARDEVERSVKYLRGFDTRRKGIDADYSAQIEQLLERFDLGSASLRAIDNRVGLSKWLEEQREQGFEPDIPEALVNEANRQHYKNMTVEELRALTDTVRQIEHLGRLKNRLLLAQDARTYQAIRDEIVASIEAHAGQRQADNRTPTTAAGLAMRGLKQFGAAHIKVASWARILDGGNDGGPVWEHFVRRANERGDMETSMRGEATEKLAAILAPVRKLGAMSGKGTFFPSLGVSLNRQERLALALNTGNAGNLQRLLDGEGWTRAQIQPVLESLTSTEWNAVQAVWDHLDSYRPQIAAKELRVYGKEPAWVEPAPSSIKAADGVQVTLRGGYYPIKYDPARSQKAEEHADAEGAQRQLRGAYTSATTRRSFTKARAEAVKGRPLLLSLDGVYGGVNDVIHDLAWHEWLIDTNRLLRAPALDGAIRERYGAEVVGQFKSWVKDIAEGDRGSQAALDAALGRLRQGVSVAGLGFNAVSAAMQPLGLSQSIVRVGAPWIGRAMLRYVANPAHAMREANALSPFMANRARTRFRELNELRNQVQDQGAFKEHMGRYAYWLMMRMQSVADVPTWWGAYDKAMAAGESEAKARALADQAVIDSQGDGQTKDRAAIERGGPALKLFTVFYSFMNTALNVGVVQGKTASTPARKARLAADMLLLYTVPAVLGALLKDALTPGGDDGDDEKLVRKLIAEQLSFLMGLFVVGREFAEVGKTMAGADTAFGYTGPAGLRLVNDTLKFGQQAKQGEFDDAFRKALVNLTGSAFGLPAAQVNRSITGAQALADGETQNPAALVLGYQKPR